jgi:hypothetical protein
VKRKAPLLLPSSIEDAHYMLNIGDKPRIKVYYVYTYIYKWYITKKAKGKGQE